MFPVRDTNDGDIKYAARSRAVVIDNRDPQQRGRIQVDHPLLGETVWIPYISDSISFCPPAIDDIVYIECDAGHYMYSLAHGRFIDGDNGDQNIPEEFQRSTPTNRGLYTPGGHLLEMDDGEPIPGNTIPDDTLTLPSSRGIRLTTQDGTSLKLMDDLTNLDQGIFLEDAGGNSLSLDYSAPSKSITVETAGGHSITMSDVDTKITIEDISGNTVVMAPEGVEITDLFGNKITTSSGGIKIKETDTGELNLSSSKVALGSSSAELLDLFDQTLQKMIKLTNDLLVEAPPGFGAPLVFAADYLSLNTELTTIKTQLDTIKGSL